jgi:hypothetical protein
VAFHGSLLRRRDQAMFPWGGLSPGMDPKLPIMGLPGSLR